MDKKSDKRQRTKSLRVYTLPLEHEEIKQNAENCGLTVSDYLRKLGLNYQPKTILDYKAVTELAKISGDSGRLGGLLKMWLTNEEKITPQDKPKINTILADIKSVQNELLRIAKRV